MKGHSTARVTTQPTSSPYYQDPDDLSPWMTETPDRAKRLEAINLLGGCCVRCGEQDPRVLQINHVFTDARHHQGTDRGANSGPQLARKIVSGAVNMAHFEVLCANCHMIVTYEALYAPIGYSEAYQEVEAV